MSLDQRMDEDLAQIMTPDELRTYRHWESRERRADAELYEARRVMRKMRAKARARFKRNNRI